MTERRREQERISEAAFEQLASELPGTELQSVLLHVMHRRAKCREPKDLLAQYERDAFCAPAAVNLRTSLEIDAEMLAAASAFEALELSPVAPLGACSVVAPTHQNRVLSALRATEVASDPTNVLALECAMRLRAEPQREVHLATSQRVLRAQPVPRLPGYSRHFRMFALASAGREEQAHGFTVCALELHVRTLLRALDRLEQNGYSFGARRVEVLAVPERWAVAERLIESLASGGAPRALEHRYYSGGLRYQIWATPPDGAELPIADGGTFDWVGKLLSNRRAVYVASGAGTQLMALRFRAVAPVPAAEDSRLA